MIGSGKGRVAARDAVRVSGGNGALSAGTEVQVPQSYTGPRMAKDITVNLADETTDPLEPAFVQSTESVFMGRSVKFTSAGEGDGFVFLTTEVAWTIPQGRVSWGEGKSAKAFDCWHNITVGLTPPMPSKAWSLGAVLPGPASELELKAPGGALYAPVPDEKLILFLKPDFAMNPAKAILKKRARATQGCLVEWIEMDHAKADGLLELFPSAINPALREAVDRMVESGEAALRETAWVAAGAGGASQTAVRIPGSYQMVTPWRIHRTTGALLPPGPVRQPWWLPPQPQEFERETIGLSLRLQSSSYDTIDGPRIGIDLNLSRRQLTGMMKIGFPGREISQPLWNGGREEISVTLTPGRSTLLRTCEAAIPAFPEPFVKLPPPSGRKCQVFVTAALAKE